MTIEHTEHTHRESVRDAYEPFGIDMKAVTIAGLLAGVVFMLFEMALAPVVGGWFWGPPHVVAGFAYGTGGAPIEPGVFELGTFIVGWAIHLLLSVVFTAILAVMIRRQNAMIAAVIGAGYGFLLYIVNFYFFTGVFEWFAAGRNVVTWGAHLLFGATAGALYAMLAHKFRERRHKHEHEHDREHRVERVDRGRAVEYRHGPEPTT